MSNATGIGSVVTFYSWKGGVGRTLALANTAVQLARAGRKVLMIDWDLEAPGLYQYFLTPGKREAEYLKVRPADAPGGLWSLLSTAMERGDGFLDRKQWEAALVRIAVPPNESRTRNPLLPTPAPLDFLPAGHEAAGYSEQLGVFSWNKFFLDAHGGEWLEEARRQWTRDYDFVLIDSRTGLTDSGGVCTIQLPNTLVLVFTANDQSFGGGMKVVEAAQRSRRDFAQDRGQLTVVPLLSRWSGDQETDIAEEWMRRFDRELRPVTDVWLPKSIPPRRYLERVRVPHVARFSFGEPLPVLTHSLTDPALPGLAFDLLAQLLMSDMNNAENIVEPDYQTQTFQPKLFPSAMLSLLERSSREKEIDFNDQNNIKDIYWSFIKNPQDNGPNAAELLMRRLLLKYLKFERETRRVHPDRDIGIADYKSLLTLMGRDEAAIAAALESVYDESGLVLNDSPRFA